MIWISNDAGFNHFANLDKMVYPQRRVKMQRTEIHVVYYSEKGCWAVVYGSGTVYDYYETQSEAIEVGRGLSKAVCGEFIIHMKNGQIQNSDSHGHDPCPPMDKK